MKMINETNKTYNRVTYRRRKSYNTKSNKIKIIKTPGKEKTHNTTYEDQRTKRRDQ